MSQLQVPLTFEERNGKTVVRFKNKEVTAHELIRSIKAQILAWQEKHPDRKHLIIDLAKVFHVSITLLGSLITVRKSFNTSGCRLVLCGLNPGVQQIFDVTRLNRLFEFADTLDEALAK